MNKNYSKILSIIFIISLITIPIVNGQAKKNSSSTNIKFYKYYDYNNMEKELQELFENHSDIMHLESLDKTYQGRDIWLVRLSDNVDIEENEPNILLMGAHHGNEKISYEILIFFIKSILENYSKPNTDNDMDGYLNEDPIDGFDNDNDGLIDEDIDEDRVRNALKNCQIYLIPMINPDGVEAGSRKNCNPDSRTGVNLNRNYGYDWIYYDVFPTLFGNAWTKSPTSYNYRGPYPFSENESRAVKNLVEMTTFNISMSYHSGTELIFYPWMHTTAKTPHEKLFKTLGEGISQISGYPLWTGSDSLIPRLGGTLGTSENFLYGKHKIIAYTIELSNSYAPSNPNTVKKICVSHIGVHLYLCEQAQIIDNEKTIYNNDFPDPFQRIQTFLQKIIIRHV